MYGVLPETDSLEEVRTEEIGEGGHLRTLVSRKGIRIVALHAVPNSSVRGTFVGVNFSGNHTVLDSSSIPEPGGWSYPDGELWPVSRGCHAERWCVDDVVRAGFGLLTFCHSDVVPDEPSLARPALDRLGADGAVAAWAWGLLSLATSIEGPVVFVGHSRMGKAALLAGAFGGDGVACIQSGCGGAAPSRTSVGETVAQITQRFPHWFSPRFAMYAGREEALPFDQHALIALCAPSPVLLLNADDDLWANPAGQEEMAELARPVYAALDRPDGIQTFRRPGGHSVTREDWAAILDFFDAELEGVSTAQT